jgi:hypothetical protein
MRKGERWIVSFDKRVAETECVSRILAVSRFFIEEKWLIDG